MNDPAREALHRIATEMNIPIDMPPQVIATTVIKRLQRIDAQTTLLTNSIQEANRRLELLGESTP